MNNKNRNKSRRLSDKRNSMGYRVALSSVMTTLALIFSYVEALIPFNFGIPGIKLGLSNLVILIALYRLGAGYAFTMKYDKDTFIRPAFRRRVSHAVQSGRGTAEFCGHVPACKNKAVQPCWSEHGGRRNA